MPVILIAILNRGRRRGSRHARMDPLAFALKIEEANLVAARFAPGSPSPSFTQRHHLKSGHISHLATLACFSRQNGSRPTADLSVFLERPRRASLLCAKTAIAPGRLVFPTRKKAGSSSNALSAHARLMCPLRIPRDQRPFPRVPSLQLPCHFLQRRTFESRTPRCEVH